MSVLKERLTEQEAEWSPLERLARKYFFEPRESATRESYQKPAHRHSRFDCSKWVLVEEPHGAALWCWKANDKWKLILSEDLEEIDLVLQLFFHDDGTEL